MRRISNLIHFLWVYKYLLELPWKFIDSVSARIMAKNGKNLIVEIFLSLWKLKSITFVEVFTLHLSEWVSEWLDK